MALNRRNASRILILFLFGLPWVLQFLAPTQGNPPSAEGADLIAMLSPPAEVETLLRQSCYDCHSYQTHWRWYSRVPPASWLVDHDVSEGRDHLNFSTWDAYTPAAAMGKLQEARSQMRQGKMPPRIYLLAHPGKRPTDRQILAFEAWLKELSDRRP